MLMHYSHELVVHQLEYVDANVIGEIFFFQY